MRTLFLRFFLSFWLIIAVTVGSAALGGYWYSEQVREAMENFDPGDAMLEAAAALESGGRDGLVAWLDNYPLALSVNLFIVDEEGMDIKNRNLPHAARRNYYRHRRHYEQHGEDNAGRGGVRRSGHLPLLVAANGETYTFVVAPSFLPGKLASNSDSRWILLSLAILISGLVSYALARALSGPVQKLRDATVALADGNLAVRVPDSVSNRRDELGLLGRDFDSMAAKLQTAVRRQTELSRNISHELRSPLARMRVAIELARRNGGELPEFERLDTETERLDELIGQILTFTRLDADARGEPTKVDLVDVVSEVVENVNFECESAELDGVSVSADIVASPQVTAHRDALLSAIENVTRNAVAHSPPNGKVGVKLSVSGDRACVDVLDDGPGVADNELANIFEPFYRTSHAIESETQQGTGLGLAIAARAVELNFGSISAANRADGGLTVTIRIPL